MKHFLLVFFVGCSSLIYGEIRRIEVFEHQSTKQKVILLSDIHEPINAEQANALVDAINSFPKKSTLVLLENHGAYIGTLQSVKNVVESFGWLVSTSWYFRQLQAALESRGISVTNIDPRSGLELSRTISFKPPETITSDIIEDYEGIMDKVSSDLRCSKPQHNLPSQNQYLCSLVGLSRQWKASFFEQMKAQPSKINRDLKDKVHGGGGVTDVDIIAFKEILTQPDKKYIFVYVGMYHANGIAYGLENVMGFKRVHDSLSSHAITTALPIPYLYTHLTNAYPWESSEDCYKKDQLTMNICCNVYNSLSMVEPSQLYTHLSPFLPPKFILKKDGSPAYPHAQHWYQENKTWLTSAASCVAAVFSGLLFKRRIFSRWG